MVRFDLHVNIYLESEMDSQHLVTILAPENATLPQVDIISKAEDEGVRTTITGKMSIGTLIRTLDDIISTVTLANDVTQNSK
ncbi:MAG: KEOPS complex subunit Pcc1 [Candidatus Kariarchaeaceae archaeon]|jgi:hypothetical protein